MSNRGTLAGAAARLGTSLAVAVLAAATFGAGALARPPADPNAQTPGRAEQKCRLHGGQVSTSRQHAFETLFARDGIRVFLYSADLNPMPVGRATGSVRFEFKDGSTTEVPLLPRKPLPGEPAVYYCSMHPQHAQAQPGVCPECGMDLIPQWSLAGKADLSRATRGEMKAVITVTGMPGGEPAATFTESYAGGRASAPETPRAPAAPKPKQGVSRGGGGGGAG